MQMWPLQDGRSTSASDLSILFTPAEFERFKNECVFISAGLKR